LYNIAVPATNRFDDSDAQLLRAYLDSVTLSEALQTRIWHTAQLTLAQARVLRKLAKEPRSLGQLGADLLLAPPSMTRLVDRLEERGLIERRRNDEDRRKVFVALTAEGRRLVSAIPFFEGSPIRTAVDRMTVADRERIAAAMREFNAAVMHAEEESLLVETEA
jgi:DNA-binding MarR family transcriptional regulator